MTDQPKCQVCGEPMPSGEEMFNYHGFSGPCPKPPLVETERPAQTPEVQAALDRLAAKGVRVNTRGCAPMDAETVEALAALADAARKAFAPSAGEKP